MDEWKIHIGLEVHVELNTNTKLFCGCPRKFGDDPNTNVCPVCLGYPGALPVLNEEALRKAVLVGIVLNSRINRNCNFYRKNYFYPDLPKGYQITQYELSLAEEGYFEFETEGKNLKRVRIRRINLEEEAAKSFHIQDNITLLDFNRSGIPLVEIVTYPDLESPREAKDFLSSLRRVLRYLDVSDCDMEKGELRADANISVSMEEKPGKIKVEIKNINSLRALEDALEYEAKRQIELIKKGLNVESETRGWDDRLKATFVMRMKEESHDYRYFPEPDLLVVNIPKEFLNVQIPELPLQKKKRFKEKFNLPDETIEVLIDDPWISDYFEKAISSLNSPLVVANLIVNRLIKHLREYRDQTWIKWDSLNYLVTLYERGEITLNKVKEVVDKALHERKPLEEILIELKTPLLISGEELKEVCLKVLEKNPDLVNKYKKGKTGVIGPLIAMVLKNLSADVRPEEIKKILVELLE